ncbi:DUF1707 SHOCT-like domain-containing protein [Micromonospora sp. CPCC 205561]|uniref:DUF1707 SHOCT-like domain-containing protein n=1 Tax=Micromonospora sp. CPCC 205561 TaxID=3122407 RepID=UPI002FEF929D
MDGRDGMRAADADRQAVADRLRVAVDEGRLDLHEYDERLQRAYAARTYGELDALVADLPAPDLVTTPAAAAPAVGRAPAAVTWRWLADLWSPYLRVVAIVSAIWAVTSVLASDLLYFWPAWVAGPWGAVLLVGTIGGLAGGEPRRWAAKRELTAAERDGREARELTAAEGEDRELTDAEGEARELTAAERERRPGAAA